jgi:hypothetical protein
MLEFELKFIGFIVFGVIAFFLLRRNKRLLKFSRILIYFISIETVSVLLCSEDQFAFIRLIAHIIFIHFPLILLILWYKGRKPYLLFLAISVIAIRCYSFIYEPTNLKITNYLIESRKIDKAIKFVVLSDIQTDHVGEYEKSVIDKVLDINPDFIIHTGDYVQCDDIQSHNEVMSDLRVLFKQLEAYPSYASGGDVDLEDWSSLFGENTCLIEHSLDTNFGNIKITGLTDLGSFQTHYRIPKSDSFHIVFGHGPDYVLSEDMGADLCLAGHTHGGQVQIPFFGPVMTLSKVRRSWASGMNAFGWDQNLVVSNGIGMERANAPRLRFNCAPEIVVIDLIPKQEIF